MIDVATIGIAMDTSGLVKGQAALKATEQAANKTADAAGRVGDAMSGASKAGVAMGAAIASAAAAGIGALAVWSKLVDNVAKLQDISEKTGASAAGLASMRTAADVAGTSIENAAQAMNRLSLTLAKTEEDGKVAAKALGAIGLSLDQIKKLAPDEQMRAIGQAMSGFSDGASKSAVAMALFGRGGAEMLPLLKELGAEQQKLSLLTEEQIRLADEYADANARTRSQLKQLAEAAAVLALPAMVALQGALLDTVREMVGVGIGADALKNNTSINEFAVGAVRALAFVIDAVDGVIRIFQHVGNRLGGVAAAAVAVAQGEFSQASRILQDMNEKQEAIWGRSTFSAKLEERLAAMNSGEQKITDSHDRHWRQREISFSATNDRMLRKAKETLDQFAKLYGQLTAQEQGVSPDFQKNLNLLFDGYRKGRISLEEYLRTAQTLTEQQPFFREQTKASEEATKRMSDVLEDEAKVQAEVNDLQNDGQKDRAKQITDANKMVEAIEFEVKTLQMSNKEREVAIALHELENAGIKKGSEAYEEYAGKIAAAVQQREGIKEQIKIWESIDQTAKDTFTNIFESGSNVFKKLGQTLKASLLDLLYQMTVRKWIISIGASMGLPGAAAAASAMGSSAGGSFLGSSAGGLLAGTSLGGPIATGAGLSGALFGTGGGASAYAMSAGALEAGVMTAGVGGTAGVMGGVMGGVTAALSAIPVWGWAAMAALAIFSMMKDKGGPKQDGRFGSLASGVAMFDRDLTPQANDTAMQAAAGIQAQYDQLAKLHGAQGGVQFGMGFSTDPKGTSPTFLDITGRRGSDVVYAGLNSNVGRTEQELQTAITEMSARAVLAGLQDSNIEGMIGDFLKSLGDVATLSASKVTEAIARVRKAGTERQALEDRLFELTHTDLEIMNRMRQREIEAIDESNRATLERVHALEDERAAQDQVRRAIEAASASSSQAMQFMSGIRGNVGQFLDTLNATPGGQLSPQAQLANARSQFERELGLARAGNRQSLEGITSYADRLIQAQVGFSASGGQTQATIAMVKQALTGLPEAVRPEQLIVDAVEAGAETIRSALLDQMLGSLLQSFDLLDADLSRAIDFSELKAFFGPLASDESIRALIARADANGDRQVSRLEALDLSTANASLREILSAQGLSQQQVATAIWGANTVAAATSAAAAITVDQLGKALSVSFDQLDASIDGALSFGELKAHFGLIASDTTIRALISRVDTNGDGMISRLEALNASVVASANAQVQATAAQTAATVAATVQAANALIQHVDPGGSGWTPGSMTHSDGTITNLSDVFAGSSGWTPPAVTPTGSQPGTTWTAPAGRSVIGAINTGGLPDWMMGAMAGYAVGTPYIPHDQIARLHRGEAVLPAPQAQAWRDGKSGSPELVKAVQGTTSEVSKLVKVQAFAGDALLQRLDKLIKGTEAMEKRLALLEQDR